MSQEQFEQLLQEQKRTNESLVALLSLVVDLKQSSEVSASRAAGFFKQIVSLNTSCEEPLLIEPPQKLG